MPTLKDFENTDEQYNPSTQAHNLADMEQQTGDSAGTSAGIDQAEAYANDPQNATSKNIDDTLNREQTAGGQSDENNQFGYQKPSATSKAKQNVKMNLLKRAGPLGLASLIFGGAGLGLFFLSPGLLLVQVKEIFTNYSSDASRAAPTRYTKLMHYTLGNSKVEKACNKNATGVKCKLGTFSERQIKAYEAAGFKVNGKDFEGRRYATSVQFPDETDSRGRVVPGKIVSTGDAYNREISRSTKSASRALRAFNPATNVFNGVRFTKNVLTKWGVDKSKVTLSGNTDEERRKDVGVRVGADEDRAKLEEDFNSKHSETISKAAHVKLSERIAGGAGAACVLYNTTRATLATAKVYNAARYVTFAMLFLKVADQIKSEGDVDPGTVAALGVILTGYATSGPEKGLSATDSQGYKIAAYGGERKLASFTQKTLLGGNSSLIKAEEAIKFIQDKVGKGNIRTACRAANNTVGAIALNGIFCAAETGGGAAAGSEVPVAGNIAGGIGGVISCVASDLLFGAFAGKVAEKFISALMPLAIDALVDAPIKTDISGVDAGNAIAVGAGTLLNTGNASRGLAPGSKSQVTHFLASTAGAQEDADRIASYDARNEPFNVYNDHSFLGSLVRKSGILNLSSASLAGSYAGVGQIFQTLISMPSTAAAANMPVNLTSADLEECNDEELQELGYACDLMGQPKYMMTDEELNMEVDDNLDYMTNSGQIDEDSGTATSGSNYEKWTKYCTEQRQDLMGSSSLPIEDGDYDWSTGRNCGPEAEDVSQTDIANYVVYYNTLADREDADTEPQSGGFSGSADFTVSSYNMCHDGNHPSCRYSNKINNIVNTIKGSSGLGNPAFDIVGAQEVSQKTQKGVIAGTSYGTFPAEKDLPTSNGRAIFWNTSKFSQGETGYLSEGVHGNGGNHKAGGDNDRFPWVQLKSSTGQSIYVISIHNPNDQYADPPTAAGGSSNRSDNAVKIREWVQSKTTSGSLVVVTGDFNQKGKTDGGKATAYCVLSEGNLMLHAIDMQKNNTGCNSNIPIDQIYASTNITGLTATGWSRVSNMSNKTGTDHSPAWVSYSTPGADNGTASGEVVAGPSKDGWVWPVPEVKSLGILGYGESGSKGIHKGIDIGISGGAALGKKVVAAHDGVVNWVNTSDDNGCGSYVSITATGTKYYAAYQHLNGSSIIVKKDDTVKAGQVIAKIGKQGGSTCGSSGFYHLHFSVESKPGMVSAYADGFPNGTINPLLVLPKP